MADEQTLEERVEALEAAVENAYALNFSGAQINELLDFVDKRKLRAGKIPVTDGGSNFYVARLQISGYKDPIIMAELIGINTGGNETYYGSPEVVLSGNLLTFAAYNTSIPGSMQSRLYYRYVIMEATS